MMFVRLHHHHLTINNISANEQFGFQTNSSTEKAINRELDQILTALNARHSGSGIFCDLKKAFDCVNHKILLSKLELYGISGPMHKLIASYLTGRFQRIKLQVKDYSQNTYSNWVSISHCAPQGSILGPLLFLIYINDFPLVLNRIFSPILFTDDTSVIIANPDPLLFLNCVNEVLNKLKLWLNTNLLLLIFSKTDFIKFNTKNAHAHDIKILYDNTEILNSSCIKFLGINIASNLKTNSVALSPLVNYTD
jgi:hypothetical protein